MLQKVYTHAIWFFIFLMISCTHEPIAPISDCIEFDIPGISFGPDFAETGTQYKAPCYNPSNPNEFSFIIDDNAMEISKLCTFNKIEGTQTILVSGNVDTEIHPEWGLGNKIAFSIGYKGYSIDLDDRLLVQMDTEYSSFYPEWIEEGSLSFKCKYVDFTDNSSGGVQKSFVSVYAEDGYQIDSFKIEGSNGFFRAWGMGSYHGEKNQYVEIIDFISASERYRYLNFIDVDKREIVKSVNIIEPYNISSITCIKWHPNGQEVYFTQWYGGLYKVNIETGVSSVVLESCDNKWYNRFSISPDGTKMLVEKVNCIFNGLAIFMNSTIVEYNMDGSGERVILE